MYNDGSAGNTMSSPAPEGWLEAEEGEKNGACFEKKNNNNNNMKLIAQFIIVKVM